MKHKDIHRERFKSRVKINKKVTVRSTILVTVSAFVFICVLSFVSSIFSSMNKIDHDVTKREQADILTQGILTPPPKVDKLPVQPTLIEAVTELTIYLPKKAHMKKEMEKAAEDIERIKKRMTQRYASYSPEENANDLLDAMKVEDSLRIIFTNIALKVTAIEKKIYILRKTKTKGH